ncbi:MAG: hypothetical protein J6T47_04990, partial [Lachnospiraceae bacterium]|nr:hypothetical protein [Lachnospiraceae bacterium]
MPNQTDRPDLSQDDINNKIENAETIDTEAVVEQAESEIRQETASASTIPAPTTISKKVVIGLAVFGALLVGAMLYLVAVMFGPSKKRVDPEEYFQTAKGLPVILNTELAEQRGMRSGGHVYIPITLLAETDTHYYHDTSVDQVLYATETQVKSYPIVEGKKTG